MDKINYTQCCLGRQKCFQSYFLFNYELTLRSKNNYITATKQYFGNLADYQSWRTKQ